MADSQADGARAGRMNKARQKQLKEMEEVKRKIAQEHASAVCTNSLTIAGHKQ